MVTYDDIWSKDKPGEQFKSSIEQHELELFSGKRVLDLGLGDGTSMLFLKSKEFEVYGLDISEEGVNKAKSQGLTHAEVGDMYASLPYADGFFDVVYSYQSLNHNTLEKITALFHEIHRILKKGGIFSVKTADRDLYDLEKVGDNIYLDKGYNVEYRFIDEQTYVPITGEEEGLVHYAFYEQQLIDEVCKIGFTLIDSRNTRFHIIANFRKTS